MTPIGLVADWTLAQGTGFTKAHLAEIVAGVGIPLPTAVHHCGALPIRQTGKKTFEPYPDGEPTLIVCATEFSDLVDLVAVGRRDWLLRTGNAVFLGFDDVASSSMGEALNIWRTPLRWLQEGGHGCCVVGEWRVAEQYLGCGRELLAEDTDHARMLDRRLTRRPRIKVPRCAA